MTTLTAIHEIIRRTASGELVVTPPGSTLTATKDEVEYLVGCGAAELSDVVATQPVAASDVGEQQGADLSKLKKAELLELAHAQGIEGADGLTVPQLREALAAAEAGDDDEEQDEVI